MIRKNIILGITGSIAAYKSADIVSKLKKIGADVKCVITQAGERFIPPLTLKALSGNQVLTDHIEFDSINIKHIELARWADLILIAPASSNFIARLAYGFANDSLSSMCLASEAPLFIAPAMNKIMWKKEITQENIAKLTARGIAFIGPDFGIQACGDIGYGRMVEVDNIIKVIVQHFNPNKILQGKKILIASGPTEEDIDAVRFISNRSSGKMGEKLAIAAVSLGAEVTFVSGPVSLYPSECHVVKVKTAEEMCEAVLGSMQEQDIFICCAAVADYRAKDRKDYKMKKDQKNITIELMKNPDILTEVAQKFPQKLLIGFAAETEDLEKNAIEKLQKKNIDIIIANKVESGAPFGKDHSAVTIINKNLETTHLSYTTKMEIADKIMYYIADFKKQYS